MSPSLITFDKRVNYYVGIDPGQSGGLACLDSYGQVVKCDKMPTTDRDMLNWFTELPDGIIRAMIEHVSAMPGQGVSSTFKFGVGYGKLLMALTAANIPYIAVVPSKWQKLLGVPSRKKSGGLTKTEHKNRLKGMAQRLFPHQKITLATADALLIAYHCYTTWELPPDPRCK